MEEKYPKDLIPDGEIRNKEKKDAELDKKIQALRKKNEALIRRYQEIEEDKRNAEKAGIAVTSRKAKQESLTITITKVPYDTKIVSEGWMNTDESEDEEEQKITLCMGNKMKLAVTMDSKVKSKRFVTKKVDQDDDDDDDVAREPSGLDMDQVDHLFTYGRGRRMQMAIVMEQHFETLNRVNFNKNWKNEDNLNLLPLEDAISEKGKKKVDPRRSRLEKAYNRDENKMLSEERPKNYSDLGMAASTAQRHSEYQQWKKERELIDFERVARQKNSRGEWRRAWDIDKKECEDDAIPPSLSGWRDTDKQMLAQTESVTKTVPTISSKAKGKDRLTGRAQRWDNTEESVIEEFSMRKGGDFYDAPQHLEVHIMEGRCSTFGNSEYSRPKRLWENKQKTANGSQMRCNSGVPCACHDTRSQEKKLSGGLGGRVCLEDKCNKQLQEKQVEDFFTDLPQADRDTIDYLSVLNSEREPTSLEQAVLVREDSTAQKCGDKECAKPQVDCC